MYYLKCVDPQVHPDILLFWLKQQVTLYDTVHITDLTSSFKDGLALCAIIHRYRPDLIDFYSLKSEEVRENNQRAFDILEKELGIPPVMTGQEMEETDLPDQVLMESYLSQIYETFRREIPHIQHPRLPEEEILAEEPERRDHLLEKVKSMHRLTSNERSILSRLTSPTPNRLVSPAPPTRKRHSSGLQGSGDKRCALSPLDNTSNSSLSRKTRKRRSGALPGTVAARKDSIEQIERNREERLSKQRSQRERDTRQFVKSMQMLAAYSRPEPGESLGSTNVDEDYGIFMYRQTAPDFKDRVKEIEQKIFHPEREVRAHSGIKTGGLDEDISGRVRNLEEKFRGGVSPGRKPKDLYRAIGKIEKTDWNVKEIEKKIEENKYGKSTKPHSERVPKWSKQQFEDKFSAVERKLRKKGFDEAAASKYAQIDQSLKQLERKIKEGSVLEQGRNKVSAMAAQLVTKTQGDAADNKPPVKVGSKPVLGTASQSGSELCHFCNKRVYLMERMNAEGRYFHRGCFRCEYCSINLRLGNYAFDREGKFGHRFFCTQHFGLPGTMKMRARRKNEDLRPTPPHPSTPPPSTLRTPETKPDYSVPPPVPKTPEMAALVKEEQSERDGTPERIEIEVDGDEVPSVMDEDEWTDRNFGASCAENSGDSSEESSDEDDETEEYSEALDVPLNADETLRLAENWTRKYAATNGDNGSGDEGTEEESGSEDESEEEEPFSYQESDSEEDEESTATEGEEEIKAREMRKQEVCLQVPDRVLPTDSDTEVNPPSIPSPIDSVAPGLVSSPPCVSPPVGSIEPSLSSPDIDSLLLDSPLSNSQEKLFESLVAEEEGGYQTEDDSYDALEEDGAPPGRAKSLDALDELPASESIENLFKGLHAAEVTKSTENFFTEVESLDKLQRQLHYGEKEEVRPVERRRRVSRPDNPEFDALYDSVVREVKAKAEAKSLAPDSNVSNLLSSDYSDTSRPVTPNLPVVNGKILVSIKPKRRSKSRSRTPEVNGDQTPNEQVKVRRKSRSKTPDLHNDPVCDNDNEALCAGGDPPEEPELQKAKRSKSRSQTPDNSLMSHTSDTPKRDRRFKRLLNRSETPDITLNDSEESLLDDTKSFQARCTTIHKSPSIQSRRKSVPQGVEDIPSRRRSRSKSHSRHKDKTDQSKDRNESEKSNAADEAGVKIVKSKLREVKDVISEKLPASGKSVITNKPDANNNSLATSGQMRSRAMSQSKPTSPLSSPPLVKKASQSKPVSPISSPPVLKKSILKCTDSTPASPMFDRKQRQTGPAQVNPIFDINLLQTKYFSASTQDLSSKPKPAPPTARARSVFFGDLKPESHPDSGGKDNKIVDKQQLVTQYLSNDTKTSRENLSHREATSDGKTWDKKKLISQYLGLKSGKNSDTKSDKSGETRDKNTFVNRNASKNGYSSDKTNGQDEKVNSESKSERYIPPRKFIISDAGQPEAPARNKKKTSRENSKVDNAKEVKRQNSNKECIVM